MHWVKKIVKNEIFNKWNNLIFNNRKTYFITIVILIIILEQFSASLIIFQNTFCFDYATAALFFALVPRNSIHTNNEIKNNATWGSTYCYFFCMRLLFNKWRERARHV